MYMYIYNQLCEKCKKNKDEVKTGHAGFTWQQSMWPGGYVFILLTIQDEKAYQAPETQLKFYSKNTAGEVFVLGGVPDRQSNDTRHGVNLLPRAFMLFWLGVESLLKGTSTGKSTAHATTRTCAT